MIKTKKRKPLFRGAATALITPFGRDGEVDYGAMERLIRAQLDAGVAALVVNGTTGEPGALSDAERRKSIALAARIAGGIVPVIAGAGSNCTKTAVRLTREAADSGADAVLSVLPYYGKATREGLTEHFAAIADASPLPVIVYNVPSRTGMKFPLGAARRIFSHPKITALKEAESDAADIMRLMTRLPEDTAVYCGSDELIAPMLAMGAQGVISVASNIFPRMVVRICDAFFRGDNALCVKLQKALSAFSERLFGEVNPVLVKLIMSQLGMCENVLRLPLKAVRAEKYSSLLSSYFKTAASEAECAL